MILVDTSTWIDYFAARSRPHTRLLLVALDRAADVCVCGVTLTEILQGVRLDSDRHKIGRLLDGLRYLEAPRESYLLAADIYRGLRFKGITIRSSIDCMVAAVALTHDVPLLHNDRDFDQIEKHFALRTVRSE